MKLDIIEAVECLHSWLKSGIIAGLRKEIEEFQGEILAEMEDVVEIKSTGSEFSELR